MAPPRLLPDFPSSRLSRRAVLAGGCSIMLSGCMATARHPSVHAIASSAPTSSSPSAYIPLMYQGVPDEPFPIEAVDTSQVSEAFWRRDVPFEADMAPGTVVVDTASKYLYHLLPDGMATRYGIGVGRQGFAWEGRATIAYKRRWPRWTPPDSMVARQPELEPYSIAKGGMDAGLGNPLGARALYIHRDGRDTLYRLHGTFQPWSIGKSVSSGCIRLLNQDVIHLYDQVRDGSLIVILQNGLMREGIASVTGYHSHDDSSQSV